MREDDIQQGNFRENTPDFLLKELLLKREQKLQPPPEELKDKLMSTLGALELCADLLDLFVGKFSQADLDLLEELGIWEEE